LYSGEKLFTVHCSQVVRLLYDEILKSFPESNRARFVSCDRAVICSECWNESIYKHECIVQTQKTLYIVIHSPRDCPTYRRHPHPPRWPTQTWYRHFLILARFRNKYLYYYYTQTTVILYTIRDQNNGK